MRWIPAGVLLLTIAVVMLAMALSARQPAPTEHASTKCTSSQSASDSLFRQRFGPLGRRPLRCEDLRIHAAVLLPAFWHRDTVRPRLVMLELTTARGAAISLGHAIDFPDNAWMFLVLHQGQSFQFQSPTEGHSQRGLVTTFVLLDGVSGREVERGFLPVWPPPD